MIRYLTVVVGLVGFLGVTVAAQDAKQVQAGKRLYESKECAKCHLIAGKGNKISPLDGVGSKHTAAEIRTSARRPSTNASRAAARSGSAKAPAPSATASAPPIESRATEPEPARVTPVIPPLSALPDPTPRNLDLLEIS